jgi:hypothetical protein
VPSNVYAAKKPARVDVVPAPVQKYKRIAFDGQVCSNEKPEVAAPVINRVNTEDSNGRNVTHRIPQGSITQNGLDSQNNIHRIEKASGGELKTQKLPDNYQKLEDSAQKSTDNAQKMLPENGGLKSQERAAKLSNLPENGLNVHKLPDKGQSSSDGLLKAQSHKSEIAPIENGPMIQHSQHTVFRSQNFPTKREEKGMEPVAATEVLNEEEHPPSLTNKDKELIPPTSWTGIVIIIIIHSQCLFFTAIM